jgi:hypothetical protein
MDADAAPATPLMVWALLAAVAAAAAVFGVVLLALRWADDAVHAQLPQHEVGGLLRDLARGKGPRTPLLITPPRRSHTH